MAPDPVVPEFRYRAFISYSHQDKAWGSWLHKALETYRVPRRLIGQRTAAGVIPKRLAPVFRDRDELASANDLGSKINEALRESANLIVICSPRSAASRWVNEEVLAFKRLGRSERIFCLIVDGEPDASAIPGREHEECFAPALRFRLAEDGVPGSEPAEPIAADAREGKDGKTNAKLKLIAGLLDIGFDALKRRELQRRVRRMTALAALAVAVMAVTTTLAITAVIARNAAVVASHAAERRQKQAENLVDFMLGDLGDKLQQVSRLDIIESVDDQAMRYFQSLPIMDVTDESLAQRTKALERIGSVRLDDGHLPAAMESFRAAAQIHETLIQRDPKSTDRLLAYARLQAFIGLTYWRQGQLDDAKATFETARTTLNHAASMASHDPTLMFELAMVENNIGHVLEAKGQLEEAAAPYHNELALCQQLVAIKPGNTDWNVQLGSAHNNVGKLALMRGDMSTAVAEYAADNAIETRLFERDPKDNSQKENVVTSRAILGRTLALTGDTGAAAQDLQQALDMAEQLRALDAKNATSMEDYALYSSQLSRLMRLTGNTAEATRLLNQSLEAFATLVKQDPSDAGWQREFAEAQTEQAEQLRNAARRDQALTQAQAAVATLSPLLAKHPHDRATLLATVRAQYVLATLTDDPHAAQQLLEDALALTRAVTGGKDDPRLLSQQVSVLVALGRTDEARPLIQKLWDTGYRDLALVNLLKHEHIDYPVNTAFSKELASRMR
ncbi:TIR domain-containing protein [Dyella silvae]|uniref:TIR domain-containing protein n=1 Tax=Dyella silvae TaxID=2994424 RepID=UPI002263D43C|nr:TIR domain-containing protein [Dyella silvae]